MEFIEYLSFAVTPANLALLLVGSLGGIFLGAMPGLSPTMAVALLIPFTFQMEATQGLILLGAIYTSSVAGGAVSAILVNIPGAPANIATVLDGYPMARNGKGALALQLTFISSFVGGVFGVGLLITLTPVLSEWALAFGASHLFWLAILGVTIMASLPSSSVPKGLLSGCIGLWLSTVGFDDIVGAQRFIFHDAVSGGINIIPAVIGLFAIPQVITIFANDRRPATVELLNVEPHPVSAAVGEVVRRWRALSIGTLIGSFIGIIPGLGGQIAGLVAYNQSRQLSPEGEKFGTGHSEGVIAAESANNAMVGPSLVPLLTLSIPGSPTAAVLLGGLLIHGIFPGSDLFNNHPDVAWTFINSMLIGQFFMCIFGLWIARFAARVARVSNEVMAAAVLGLAVFGSYSVQHSMGDVYVMATLGIGMYFLERFGFPAAPLTLGLILGPIAEANFVEGVMIANATSNIWIFFMSGPLNLTLIAIILSSIIYLVWMKLRHNPRIPKDEVIVTEGKEVRMSTWQPQQILVSGLLAAAGLGVVYISYTTQPAQAFLFPRIISTCFAILTVWILGEALIGKATAIEPLDRATLINLTPGILITVIYIFLAAEALGFYAATALAALSIFTFYDPASSSKARIWIKRILIAFTFTTMMYGLFAHLLNVFTPPGVLL